MRQTCMFRRDLLGGACGRPAVDFVIFVKGEERTQWHLCQYHWDRAQSFQEHPAGSLMDMPAETVIEL